MSQPQRQMSGRRPRREESHLVEKMVKINRCATVVKGGRRFSFSALVVVGDRRGRVGVGYGKANEVPNAIEKAFKKARESMQLISVHGRTIPHEVVGQFGASKVWLKPASDGTGIIAGNSVRAVIEGLGVQDIMSKCYGSTNPINVTRATLDGLRKLRSREEMSRLRGVRLPGMARPAPPDGGSVDVTTPAANSVVAPDSSTEPSVAAEPPAPPAPGAGDAPAS